MFQIQSPKKLKHFAAGRKNTIYNFGGYVKQRENDQISC